jgi:hypothetical protein
MAKIYGNAYLTITAEAARDCAQGFLARRPDQSVAPHEIRYYLPDGTECGSVKVCLKEKEEAKYVARRAWTFQERKLSRRILSFHRRWTTFACQEGYTEEFWESFILPQVDYTPAPLTYKSLEDCLECWYSSVGDYSRRSMAFEKDKFPAFSGYAHSIQKHVRGKYLAGLWDCDLHSGLLWAPYPASSATKPSEFRAPSWSWAALNGEVFYNPSPIKKPDEYRITIIECSVELSSDDPMGQVSGGFLTCWGPLIEGSWLHDEEYPENVILYHIDELAEEHSKIKIPGLAYCVLDTKESDYQPHLWCLLVVSNSGLLLELSRHDNNYRRVGSFETLDDSWTSKWSLSTVTIV